MSCFSVNRIVSVELVFQIKTYCGIPDFSCVLSLNKQRVLELARGSYLEKAVSLLMVGNPGLGKTHGATGLGLAACQQGHRVRFYNSR